MKTFPKLRYPIHTKGLSLEDRAILLAYDMLWKIKFKCVVDVAYGKPEMTEDLEANLANLGHLIEKNICGMDLSLRFEGYDNLTSPITVSEFKTSEEVQKEWHQKTEEKING